MTTRKRDKNNFIPTILSKIELANNFHQRIDLAITRRVILSHVHLAFYIRRRHNTIYLYMRVCKEGFGSRTRLHQFYVDLTRLIPTLKLEGTQGHYKGCILEIKNETKDDLVYLLKLISLLSKPKDFYVKDTKIYKSFLNYTNTSSIPIHLQITQSKFLDLKCYDIYKTLTEIKPYDSSRENITSTSTNSTNS